MEGTTFQEIIVFAIEREVEAAEWYEEIKEMTENSNTKRMLDGMIAEEQRHKEILEGITEEDAEDASVKTIPDLKISDYIVEAPLGSDSGYQDVLIAGMKREERSVKLYTEMAQKLGNPKLQRLFRVLAQEEAKHKLAFEKEYDEYVLTEM